MYFYNDESSENNETDEIGLINPTHEPFELLWKPYSSRGQTCISYILNTMHGCCGGGDVMS